MSITQASIIIDGKASKGGGNDIVPSASHLFDVPDAAVQIARSRASSHAPSHASGPPTSDYDDLSEDRNENPEKNSGSDDIHSQDEDSDESVMIIPPRRSRQTGWKEKVWPQDHAFCDCTYPSAETLKK